MYRNITYYIRGAEHTLVCSCVFLSSAGPLSLSLCLSIACCVQPAHSPSPPPPPFLFYAYLNPIF